MNEKIMEIENMLKDLGSVSLAKQCKQEYIVYSFHTDYERTAVIRRVKDHYSDRNLNKSGKRKMQKVKIPIKEFLDSVAYDLLNRGYTLERFE